MTCDEQAFVGRDMIVEQKGNGVLSVSGLEKSYGETRAVQGISFELSSGECFGLLGPNGAGKTTAISMIVGLLRPDKGSVNVAGLGTPEDPAIRKQVGVAPQTISLYEELTARENLAFLGSLYDLRGGELDNRVTWALEFAGLKDRSRHRVSSFSGGMKRRLNLASALVHNPKVVLMDEPTVGVDPQSRNHIFDCIEQLNRKGWPSYIPPITWRRLSDFAIASPLWIKERCWPVIPWHP